jgi:hypothetical protein
MPSAPSSTHSCELQPATLHPPAAVTDEWEDEDEEEREEDEREDIIPQKPPPMTLTPAHSARHVLP